MEFSWKLIQSWPIFVARYAVANKVIFGQTLMSLADGHGRKCRAICVCNLFTSLDGLCCKSQSLEKVLSFPSNQLLATAQPLKKVLKYVLYFQLIFFDN